MKRTLHIVSLSTALYQFHVLPGSASETSQAQSIQLDTSQQQLQSSRNLTDQLSIAEEPDTSGVCECDEAPIPNLLLDKLNILSVSDAKKMGLATKALGKDEATLGDAFYEGYETAVRLARVSVKSEYDRLVLYPTNDDDKLVEGMIGECAAHTAYSVYRRDEDIKAFAWLAGFYNYQNSLNRRLSNLHLTLREKELRKLPRFHMKPVHRCDSPVPKPSSFSPIPWLLVGGLVGAWGAFALYKYYHLNDALCIE
ncbi:MAG: hypothetical protein LBJ92_04295 [Holosporales bacterium]|jgi:hypothetical protein|nr:hypothetical protein [Holosporales bacterium]